MNGDSFFKGVFYTIGVILILVFISVLTLYSAWVGAFVSVHLWMWFVVPTFGLAPLKLPIAFGLFLLVNLWSRQHHTSQKDERGTKERAVELISLLLNPWVVLLMGYICHHYFV